MNESTGASQESLPGLKRQVVGGLFWVTLAQFSGRLLATLTQLILLKLLTPAQFGLVGMAALAINAVQFLQDMGFDAALVYKRKDVDKATHTAFITVLASSFMIFAAMFLASPLVARFFREPAVTPILRTLSLTILITGFGRIPYILLSRELNFKRRLFPDLTAQTVASLVAIWLAFRGAGVWALVWRELIRTTLATSLVWLVSPYRPRLRFDVASAREMFGYSKHIVSAQGLIFLITNVDNLFVGRYAGGTALGYYQMAYNLSNLPATQVTTVVSQVMFPTFSKMADSNPASAGQMRARYYLTTVRYITWLTVPIAVAMILYASDFFVGIYGAQWAAAVVPLQLLAIYALIRSIAANMGSIFRAMGKPQWLTYIALWRLITMAAALYPVTVRWGINGVAALSVAVAIVDFIISASLVGRLVEAPWRAYAEMLIPTTLAALASGYLSYWVYGYLPIQKVSVRLLAAGMIMTVLYSIFIWVIDRRFRAAARMIAGQALRIWRQRSAAAPAAARPNEQL